MRGGTALFIFSGVILLIIPVPILQWFARSLLLLVGLSWIYSFLQRRYVWIDREREEVLMYRHASTQVSVLLTNYLPLPVPGVLVSDEPGALISDNRDRAILQLSPGQRSRLSYTVKAHERGRYRLGPLTIQSADPLGFFPWERVLGLPGSVIVFPKVYPLHLLLERGSPTGPISTTNPLYEDPSRLRSFHEYQPGDDPRRIQWKISARTGVIHVSEYLASLSVPGIVLLNLNSNDYSGKRDFHHSERAIEAAASAIQHWSDIGEQFALITNGRLIPGTPGSTLAAVAEAKGRSTQDEEENSESEKALIYPFSKGKAHASVILTALATVARTEHEKPELTSRLFEAVQNLRPSPGTRIIYIGPSLARAEFSRYVAGFSPSWNQDLWLLDERVNREDHIQPGTSLPGRRYRILKIREYGEDVFDE